MDGREEMNAQDGGAAGGVEYNTTQTGEATRMNDPVPVQSPSFVFGSRTSEMQEE